MILPSTHRVSQAQALARAAYDHRINEPVAAFRRWTLATLLMKRAYRAASRLSA